MKHFALVLLALANGIALSQTFQPNDWMVDGVVLDMVAHPNQNKVFIAGEFNYVGPVISQQNAVALDAITGAVNTAFPVVVGVVDIAIPDGAGGWYIGGQFTQVGGSARNSLARINASGAVLPFNPNPTSGGIEGSVSALALSGDTLFVGGDFDAIGGQLRNYLAAVSVTTGNAFSWDALVNDAVSEIVVSSTRVFIAGNFSDIGGETISNIAELVRTTALPDVAFPTVTGGGVNALALSGDTLFIGGTFTTVGASARQKLASINPVTNAVTAWNPSPNGVITAILAHGNSLYVGGEFTVIAGENKSVCVQFTVDDATLTNWYRTGYNCSFGEDASALAFGNGAVYVARILASVPGLRGPAAFDSVTGVLTDWHPAGAAGTNTPAIRVLAISGTQIYVSGIFSSIGGKARDGLAAIDVASGTATDWNVGTVNGTILALTLTGNTLFVGGGFSAIGCLPSRQGLAALDATTGAVLSWQADIQNGTSVDAMKVSGSTLYVGGTFNSVGGQSRNRLAAINTSTASVESWNPNATGSGFTGINAIETVGTTVYVGGFFSSVGGASRDRFAALDATTGLATSFDAGAILPTALNVSVYALAASESGNILYVGGNFTQVSGQSRRGACAYDLTTLSLVPTLTSWNPSINGVVLAIHPALTSVYIGGNLDSIGTARRRFFGSVSTGGGLVSPFNPDLSSSVEAIETNGTSLFAGGYADSVSSQFHPGLARFIDPSLPVQLASFSATRLANATVRLHWRTISEVNNYGFFVQRRSVGMMEWWSVENSFVPGHGTTNEPHEYSFTDNSAPSGNLQYRLKQVDLDGTVHFSEPITVSSPTSVNESAPTEFRLEQNYPNPFNPATKIRFNIPVGTSRNSGTVSLQVFDVLGRDVATLVNQNLNAGNYEVDFDASSLASGVYFYTLHGGDFIHTKRMLLLR